jgi:hypothetical protein
MDRQNLSWLREYIRYKREQGLPPVSNSYLNEQLEKAVQNNWEESVIFLSRIMPHGRGLSKNILNIAIRNNDPRIIDNLMPLGDAHDVRSLANILEVEDSLENYNNRKNKQKLAKDILYKYMDQGPATNEYMRRQINSYMGFGAKRSKKRSRKMSRKRLRKRLRKRRSIFF